MCSTIQYRADGAEIELGRGKKQEILCSVKSASHAWGRSSRSGNGHLDWQR